MCISVSFIFLMVLEVLQYLFATNVDEMKQT